MGDSGKNIPQGPTPTHFIGFTGTTEVVPFQNLDSAEFFRKL